MKEWICKEEPLIRSDGASVGIGFREMQELVRCKDCIYHNKVKCPLSDDYGETMEDDDWFCADGERRKTDA